METETESGVDSIQALLLSNPALKRINEKRILCSFTKHEIPCTEKAILQHINGKRYTRLNKNTAKPPSSENSFESFQPHIIPSTKKGHENQLFCTLTLRHINKIHHHVERHINGRKFKNAKARWEKCQQSGETFVPTPMQNRNKRNEKNDKNEDESEMGDEEDGGPPGDDLSDLYPDMDFNKLTIQEEIVEKKVLSHLQQKKRKRRKRTSNRVVALGGTKKQQRKNMSAVVCRDEEVIPSKQMKVMQGAGGSELLVYN